MATRAHRLLLRAVRLATGVAALGLAGTSVPARAATWGSFGVDSLVGLMQQPTSHYYLLIYGASVQYGTPSESLLLRGTYWQRPVASSAGYTAQDDGWWGEIGTKITKEKDRGLYAYCGFGRSGGFVTDQAGHATSTYLINGAVFDVDYAMRFGKLDVAIGHQQFIGYVSKFQVDAYVAWPFSFYSLNVGVAL